MGVVVIGGGISGLSAAWTLSKRGVPCTVVEPGIPGGLLRTEYVDGCTIECGADSWIRSKPFLRNLAGELGLGGQIIPCNEDRKTLILREGRLIPLPRGLRMIVPTEWGPLLRSPLLGWGTKLRMLMETRRKPADLGDRSIAEFVRDHFGDEAVEYLAEPLFAGVYGGVPENLGVAGALPKMLADERDVGSLIRAARREKSPSGPLFETMRGGLGQIPGALAARLTVLRAHAEAVETGRVRINGEWLGAEEIILACGAPAAARLLGEDGALLAQIPHSSATIVVLAFRRADVPEPPAGFGFLVPRKERQTVMAGTFVNRKFPNRAPDDLMLMRCFLSGDHGETILADVLADLRRILGITSAPIFTRHYRWPESMPQYTVGHAGLLGEIRRALPARIHLAGAFLNGVGMPDCAKQAGEMAEGVC